jgi:hypothetical protein
LYSFGDSLVVFIITKVIQSISFHYGKYSQILTLVAYISVHSSCHKLLAFVYLFGQRCEGLCYIASTEYDAAISHVVHCQYNTMYYLYFSTISMSRSVFLRRYRVFVSGNTIFF